MTRLDLAWPPRADSALAAVLTVFGVVALAVGLDDSDTTASAVAYLLVVLAGVAIAYRRRQPVGVLAVAVVTRLLVTWDTGNEFAVLPMAIVALYTAARTGDRRGGLMAALIGAGVMMVVVAALADDAFFAELLGEGALMLLPVALGEVARTREERVRDLIETEAATRVQAERIRIARDLHDVVAHGLSTIAVQSGIAARLLDRDPEQARDALETINATGKASLEELRAMVGVLRSTDDAPLRPAPSDPDDLDELLAAAAAGGAVVTTEVAGAFPADVGDACVLTTHRILQEALTNVARHAGSAPAQISILHHRDHVEVRVVNDAPVGEPAVVASTGVGIIGMRERAESLGGELVAAPTGSGGFEVVATIPYYRRPDEQ